MRLRTLLLALALSGALTSAVYAAPAVAKHAKRAKIAKRGKVRKAAKRKTTASKSGRKGPKAVRHAAPRKTAKYKAPKVKKHKV